MTLELKESLNSEMNEAVESGDAKRIWLANFRYNKAMADCQYKTARRVKRIERYLLWLAVMAGAGGTKALEFAGNYFHWW